MTKLYKELNNLTMNNLKVWEMTLTHLKSANDYKEITETKVIAWNVSWMLRTDVRLGIVGFTYDRPLMLQKYSI